ncbi:hypothetical protein CN397_23970 [Priestia megaterium]|uniref:hypothetical protein n=1 Tax=Priestia megaterium TaxID=1404 RepID=UPI000BF367DD|nr:hypothetical protein [Priestia megaterium]PEU68118.1 hypothetical protein CN397_23970 [Priestia megaterium]
MGMAILFRNEDIFNPFKRAMLDLIAEDGDTLILSTGYIDLEIADELINGIKNSFKGRHGEIIIIAGHVFDTASKHYGYRHSKNRNCLAKDLPFRGYIDFLNGEKILLNNYIDTVVDKYISNSSHYSDYYNSQLSNYKKRKPGMIDAYYRAWFKNFLRNSLQNKHLSKLKVDLEKDKTKVCWYCHINVFTWYLRDQLKVDCPNLSIRVIFATDFLNHSWHSKISMITKKNTPIASIIGSSNLTKAVWKERTGNFHFEADIYIKSNGTNISLRSDTSPFSVIHVDPRTVNENQLLGEIYNGLKGSAKI